MKRPFITGQCGADMPPHIHALCKREVVGHACVCECHAGIRPGLVEQMPNEEYHAQTGWVSSTYLKSLLPEHYKAAGSRDALDFGSAFHTRALGEGGEVVVVDAASWRSKAAETARAEADAAGRIPVLATDSERIDAMVKALHDHETAAELLYRRPGRSELSAFAEVDGVPCRARFDRYIDGVVIDLKSTSVKPGRDAIGRAVIDYGYDLSAAHYLAVADALGLDAQAFALVFVSKAPGPNGAHYVNVCDLDAAFLTRGAALRERALARHLNPTADRYEGASGFLTLNCPRWAEMELSA